MKRLLIRTFALLLSICFSTPALAESMGWSLAGGKPWRDRLGPGAAIAIGGNDCTGEYCDDVLDTALVGSFGGTFEFYWRVIPNLSAFLDVHAARLNTDHNDNPADGETWSIKDDSGLLFQTTVGAEFHAPFTGWFEAYLGFGIGFAMLRSKAVFDNGNEMIKTLKGIDFELKIGTDFYLFSRLPTLGIGPLFRMGFTVWPSLCIEMTGDSQCDSPDAQANEYDYALYKETPFLVFLGLATRYSF